MKRGRDQINKDVGIKFKVHWEATGVTYDLGSLKWPQACVEKKTMRNKTGRPVRKLLWIIQAKGRVDYYVAIKKNEEGYNEKNIQHIFTMQSICLLLKTVLHTFAENLYIYNIYIRY